MRLYYKFNKYTKFIMNNIEISGQTFKANEFKISSLIRDENNEYIHPRIVIIAPSGSGKSWIVKNILHEMKDIPCALVVAPTDQKSKFYDDFIPPTFIHYDYKPEILIKVLDRQDKIIEKNQARVRHNKKEVDPRAVFIMDDCMGDKDKWVKDPNMLKLMNQGRHSKLTYILTMQYVLGIQPELRTQFNYIFLLGEDNFASRKKLYEHYAGIFPTYDLFDQIFRQLTTDHGCMVINNRIKSTNLAEKVFWFKAKDLTNSSFKIGIPKYIRYHNEHYDPNYRDRQKLFDISTLNKKRNKQNIIVKLVK